MECRYFYIFLYSFLYLEKFESFNCKFNIDLNVDNYSLVAHTIFSSISLTSRERLSNLQSPYSHRNGTCILWIGIRSLSALERRACRIAAACIPVELNHVLESAGFSALIQRQAENVITGRMAPLGSVSISGINSGNVRLFLHIRTIVA